MNEYLKVLELFAGIGACSKALDRLLIPHMIVDAVEIDKYAIKSFNAIHGTNFEPQDITKWDKNVDVDLIMHGSPCQDFSVAGRQAGGDEGSGTRSSLMYETLRIVDKLHPKFVIWENVKNLLSKKHRHNFDAYIESMRQLGYVSSFQVLNAKDYGIPQNRERVFTVSIREDVWDKEYNNFNTFDFPEPIELKRKLKDMLEDEVDEKYFISENMMNYFMGVNQKPSKFPRKERFLANINRKDQDRANSITTAPGQRPTDNFIKVNLKTDLCNKLVKDGVVKGGEIINHSYTTSEQRNTLDKYIESNNGVMPTLTTRPDCLGYATLPPNVRIRKLTPKECWRLMGFDDSDIEKAQAVGISNAQLYKQAGNSIVVDVLVAILGELLCE